MGATNVKSAAKIDFRERRMLSTSSCPLHLPPALGCPIPSHITLPASPTLAAANYPQPPAIRRSIFATFPLRERGPRVTSRDSMSSPNNVPSVVHLLSTLLP